MSDWIKFTDKLPDEGQRVLVTTFNLVTIGVRTSGLTEKLRLSIMDPINYQFISVDLYDYHIQYWMPLPKYKEDK